MKHFSSLVSRSCVFEIAVDSSLSSLDFIEIQSALIVAMDANPSNLSLSEKFVIRRLETWFRKAKQDDLYGYPLSPVFTYVNITSGFTLVAVLTDYKGKTHFRSY